MEYFEFLHGSSELHYKCPNCNSVNICNIAVTDDDSYCPLDGMICWSCKKAFFLCEINAQINEYDTECGLFDKGEKE